MAVVSCSEVIAGTSASGKFGESVRLTRKWTVRVDDMQTSKAAIIAANLVNWGDAHPDFAACKAMEFELSNSDEVGMRWTITVTYYIPPRDKKVNENGIPEDYWEASGGTATIPAFEDINGDTITNSAGDPLEGLEKERSEFGWTLTKFYTDDTWTTDAVTCSNTVNDDTWSGCAAGTWKAEFKSAKLREITPTGEDAETTYCVETHWEFRYDASGWKALPWDVGFMELDDSGSSPVRKTIKGSDGKAVKQPVALNPDGSAKAAGEKPDIINGGAGAEIYEQTDFSTTFGNPSIYPA